MKKVLVIGAVILALFVIFMTEDNKLRYQSSIMPVSFEYPKGYVVSENADTIILMLEEDYQSVLNGEREGGEGPAAITIRAIDNPNNPRPREWAEQYPQQSNYNLRMSDVTEITVSGLPGVSYSADGLYPNRNVIIATEYRLFYINGAYMDQESPLYKDFDAMVQSITVE